MSAVVTHERFVLNALNAAAERLFPRPRREMERSVVHRRHAALGHQVAARPAGAASAHSDTVDRDGLLPIPGALGARARTARTTGRVRNVVRRAAPRSVFHVA